MRRLAAIAAIVCGMCSPSDVGADSTRGCDITDARAVFDAPLDHDGKSFCGRVYMVLGGPRNFTIAFYPGVALARQARYDLAMIAANSVEVLKNAGGDGFVIIHGRLEVMRECFVPERSVLPDGEVVINQCTPYRRPIFIEITYARIPN